MKTPYYKGRLLLDIVDEKRRSEMYKQTFTNWLGTRYKIKEMLGMVEFSSRSLGSPIEALWI